nr:MAG TPA: hypothetical protein [Caudoviricetes sp.]
MSILWISNYYINTMIYENSCMMYISLIGALRRSRNVV